MSSVEIRKVTNRKELDAFIQFHYDLYRGNEYDAPNLYTDELHTLSKDRNASSARPSTISPIVTGRW